jgi:hypothetical protein
MTAFEDGSVLYATWPPRMDDPDHGVFLMTPDGDIDGVSTGMLVEITPMMMVINVAPEARKASAVSLQNYNLFNPDNLIWVELDLDTGIPTRFEEILSLPAGVDAREQDLVLFAAPAFLTGDDGALTGYLYATADVGYDVFTLWRRDLGATAPEEIGTVARPDRDVQGVLRIPRVTVTPGGNAALFFGGTLWTIGME